MGTNYYWVTSPCEHCGRADDRLHIGKNRSMFHGTFDYDDNDDPTPAIVSWQQWRDFLRSNDGRIVDEYGHEHDVEDFIAKVEQVPMDARRWQYDWVAGHPRYGRMVGEVAPGADWLDDDGFSFYGAEFS